MSRRLDKMRKIVRFREFRESMAADSMRQRLAEAQQASQAFDSAQNAVDDAESWKARAVAGGSVDVGLYGFALEDQNEKMERRDAAKDDLEGSRKRVEEAAGQWRDAASETRVARERTVAEKRLFMDASEKQVFDQLGDLLISRRTGSDDWRA